MLLMIKNLFDELAKVAMRVLKPGDGGGLHLGLIYNELESSGLKCNLTCFMKLTGATQAMYGNHVIVCEKLLL